MLTNHIHKFCISIQKTIKESATYTPFNSNDDFSALQKMSKNQIFEPTNETRNSDKTLRMMSPIHYGIAPSILVW